MAGVERPDYPPIEAIDERANEVLEILTELCDYYPFPHRGHTVKAIEPHPLTLNTYEDVIKWLETSWPLMANMQIVIVQNSRSEEFFRLASETHRRTWGHPELSNPEISNLLLQLDPLTTFHGIASFLKAADQIRSKTAALKGEITAYQVRLQRLRPSILGTFVVAIAAFVAGVVAPMVLAITSKNWYAIVVPCAAYVALLVVAAIWIFRRLGRVNL